MYDHYFTQFALSPNWVSQLVIGAHVSLIFISDVDKIKPLFQPKKFQNGISEWKSYL